MVAGHMGSTITLRGTADERTEGYTHESTRDNRMSGSKCTLPQDKWLLKLLSVQ